MKEFCAKPRLVLRADARRELGQWPGEGARFRFLPGKRLGLAQNLFEQDPGGRALVRNACFDTVGHLRKSVRHRMHARDVVFVILDGHERRDALELGQADLDAVELIDWHLPWFEAGFLLGLDQAPDHEVARKLLLLGETLCADGTQAGQKGGAARQILVVGRGGPVVQAIVVAGVADRSRKLRMVPKCVLPDLVKKLVERGRPLADGDRRRGGGSRGGARRGGG